MSKFDERLFQVLSLDRRAIYKLMNAGCDRKIIDYLLSRFCVSEETDANEDLGFKFNLWPKTHIAGNQSINGKYVLYLSCVIPCAAIRFYAGSAEMGYRSDSVALSEKAIKDNQKLSELCKFLEQSGYTILTNRELTQSVDEKFQVFLNDPDDGYFNLIFSEYQ